MIVLVMGYATRTRRAVATALAERLGWTHVQLDDEPIDGLADRIEMLCSRMAATLDAGRTAVYSSPQLSAGVCRSLREALRRIELVRLLDAGDRQPPLVSALTVDGSMSPSVIAATIAAVFRLADARDAK